MNPTTKKVLILLCILPVLIPILYILVGATLSTAHIGSIEGHYNSTDNRITLFDNSTSVMAHEECHRQHWIRNNWIAASGFKLFIEEAECYFVEVKRIVFVEIN